MNKIEKLINDLCPDGVEYKYLWEITTWNKKFKNVDRSKQPKIEKFKSVSANYLKEIITVDCGDIKLLSTGNYDGFTLETNVDNQYISQGEIITLPEGGDAIIKYWNGKFVNSLNLLASSSDNKKYNLKYIYYFLLNKINLVKSMYKGSSIKHPDMNSILNISVAVPPLEIQNEIVKVLDKFTELTTELTTELKLRKKQYEYYRNKLLTFKESEGGGSDSED